MEVWGGDDDDAHKDGNSDDDDDDEDDGGDDWWMDESMHTIVTGNFQFFSAIRRLSTYRTRQPKR